MATGTRDSDSRSAAAARGGPSHGDCRYQRQIAGTDVCWAATTPGIVINTDCGDCAVPGILDRVDCYYLQPRVEASRPMRPRWICGATGECLGDPTATDAACDGCWRKRPAGGPRLSDDQ